MEIISLLKWPLLACLLLPWLLVYLGLHIVQRQIIFVDLALAQVAALGAALGMLLGYDVHDWQSYAFSLGFTFAGAVLFTFTRTGHHRVPQEALIGIVYVVAAAAGILVLSHSTGGKEELQRSMVGELLVVQHVEIFKMFGLFVAVGIIHFLFRKKFLAVSADPAAAAAQGISVRWWDFVFYMLFGLVVTSFVHVGGVLLAFTFLIVPAVCANYLADSMGPRLIIGWVVATVGSLLSLVVTAKLDFPIGATIVCGLALLLILTLIFAAFRGRLSGKPSGPTLMVRH